jgi:uncharacterized protein (TIGR00296 family)
MVEVSPAFIKYCFDVLVAHLSGREAPEAPAEIPSVDACLFVTYNKKGRLAGCKGITGGPRPLAETLAYFAVESAVNDTRFRPLKLRDVNSDLSCGVSVLHSFEDIESAFDWQLERHGITIEFRANNRRFHATYLPGVAQQQGWSVRETLESLIRKAGFEGEIDDKLLSQLKCTRYQASKLELGFDDVNA